MADDKMIEIRWHGRGGQGAFTASKILGKAAVLENKYGLSFPAFGPERRGAPIQAFTKINDKPIKNRSAIKTCDYIIYLDETLYSPDILLDLKDNGKLILNSSNPLKYSDKKSIIAFDGTKIAMEFLHKPITNTAMLAALVSISNIVKINHIKEALQNYLPYKLAENNSKLIDRVNEILTD